MKHKSHITNYDDFHKTTTFQKKIITQNNFTYRHILKVLVKYLQSPKKVLDIGCGAGTIDLYIANKKNEVHGIDISKHAITEAAKSAKYLHMKNAKFSVMKFPEKIPNEKYDFIICSEVIEHLKDDQLAINKMYSLLKKNGIAFISTPSSNAPLHKLGVTKNFDKEVGHLRRYTMQELETKVKKSGFTILETKKTEGIVRNFLFINPIAGKFVRFVKYFIADGVTWLDNVSVSFFGESNLFIVVQKK